MATLKKTIKDYPQQYENGKIYYHKVNAQFKEIWEKYCFELSQQFEIIKFLTDSQRFYLDKRRTWAWFKTYLDDKFCLRLLEETELKDIVEHYALCYHDKDKAEPHTHVLIKFYRNESYLTKLFEYFHCDNISDPSHKLKHCFDYLTHNSKQCKKDGKWVYSEEERKTDDNEYWANLQDLDDNKNDIAINIYLDILANKTIDELVHLYGREYIIYRKQYHETAWNSAIQQDRIKGIKESDEVDDEF